MDFLVIPLAIISILISLLSLYTASNLNKKLQRLRRRYDFLLRGRGELNIEELIVKYGEELDGQIEKLGFVETRMVSMDERLLQAEGSSESIVDQKLTEVENRLDNQFNEFTDSTSGSLQRMEESVFARLDQVERGTIEKMDANVAHVENEFSAVTNKLTNQVDGVSEKLNNQMETFSSSMVSQMKKLEEDNYVEFHEIKGRMDADSQTVNQQLKDIEARCKDEITKQVLELRDHLATAYQKAYLYRYNAFEDLSGEQSFSFAILDENDNGILVTSIYSRHGASTFAKNIENGKPMQGLSPEEQVALQRAMTKGY